VFWFSRKQRVAQGSFVRENEIVFRQDGKDEVVLKLQDIPLAGAHNVENVMAAVAAARLAGASAAEIASGVRSFAGVEHRLEFVAEIGGVHYYNDSEATNVDATLKALDAFPGRILIVLGGKDKGSDYTVLQKPLREKAIPSLLIGAASRKLKANRRSVRRTRERSNAVELSRRGPGTSFLAPHAPLDQFDNTNTAPCLQDLRTN
jgi:UDP-N-acetylmuramoylalanine--D-glutamate ligase